MKIKKTVRSAKVASFSIRTKQENTRYRSPKLSISSRVIKAADAKLMPVVMRLRSVVPRADGTVEYRTVGSVGFCTQFIPLRLQKLFQGSPWALKRPPARIVTKMPEVRPLTSKIDFAAEGSESSSSEACSSDENELDEVVSSDTDDDKVKVNKRRKSLAPPCVSFKVAIKSLEKKRSSIALNPRMAVKKVETLEDFRRRLHTAQVPERMPCREAEASEVERFIRNAISVRGTSSAMYISGVPGTGKTATVMSVRVVKQLIQDKKTNKFCFVAVNAMEYIEPKRIFVEIYNQITGNVASISPAAARRKLNAMFEMADKCRPAVVILIDELDQLCTKKQELIYDIFNWTSVESARVSVMAIANTLDLPERLLSQRVTSRIGAARICFQPYEFQEIERIIHDRLKDSTNAIDEAAVQIAARKMSFFISIA
ncbi:unnamed protein product [Strongylus vulgaris]|uniref:Origin recognition complex subunit 1 n=1 Tax=Strongylus vulgaris TaxID=40348 RepID=A0A3P7IKC8_STRVU|nr:unnamed protein product [Strongylus vulgaris]